jgi:hypothetical protein
LEGTGEISARRNDAETTTRCRAAERRLTRGTAVSDAAETARSAFINRNEPRGVRPRVARERHSIVIVDTSTIKRETE